MKKTSGFKDPLLHGRATLSERRHIAAVTLAFILLSAALHFALGSIQPSWRYHETVSQSPAPFVISNLVRPSPTPQSSPVPSPTEKPQRAVKPLPLALKPVSRKPAVLLPPVRGPIVRAVPATPSLDAEPQPPQPVQQLPPSPEAIQTPVDARDVIVSARFTNRVRVEYPLIAIENRWEGTVIILLTIGPSGIGDVRVGESSGYGALDKAALRAAEESGYSIPEINGQPATETYRIIYTFSLDS